MVSLLPTAGYFLPLGLKEENKAASGRPEDCFVDIKAFPGKLLPERSSPHPRQPGTQGRFGRCGERERAAGHLGSDDFTGVGRASWRQGLWETLEAP